MNLRFASILLFAVLFVGSACKKNDDDASEPTLYEKLGGTNMVTDPVSPSVMIEEGRLGIRSVVDSSIFVVAADPNLTPYSSTLIVELANSNISGLTALSENFTDFLCEATGSENFSYNGLNMADAHDPTVNSRMEMVADDTDFDHFKAAVVAGATQNNLSSEIIDEISALVETLRSDIVQ